MSIVKKFLMVAGTIAFIIYGVIGIKYVIPKFDEALIESAESGATEQFESQHPTTGKINEIALFGCKTVFVKNTTDSTEECLLDIVTNNNDSLTVSIIHEEDAFKYHNAEISVGDTIEYRVDNIDRSKGRFYQPAIRPDIIDSINGVAVKHEE